VGYLDRVATCVPTTVPTRSNRAAVSCDRDGGMLAAVESLLSAVAAVIKITIAYQQKRIKKRTIRRKNALFSTKARKASIKA